MKRGRGIFMPPMREPPSGVLPGSRVGSWGRRSCSAIPGDSRRAAERSGDEPSGRGRRELSGAPEAAPLALRRRGLGEPLLEVAELRSELEILDVREGLDGHPVLPDHVMRLAADDRVLRPAAADL